MQFSLPIPDFPTSHRTVRTQVCSMTSDISRAVRDRAMRSTSRLRWEQLIAIVWGAVVGCTRLPSQQVVSRCAPIGTPREFDAMTCVTGVPLRSPVVQGRVMSIDNGVTVTRPGRTSGEPTSFVQAFTSVVLGSRAVG
jgi:hypothetical protein